MVKDVLVEVKNMVEKKATVAVNKHLGL